MSCATEYQSVPTTIQPKIRRHRPSFPVILTLCATSGIMLIVVGIPFIVVGVLEYKKVDYLSTQPSSCRVNTVGREGTTRMIFSNAYPVWNVDIVKQLQSNNSEKNLVVLRSSLKIKVPGDYQSSPFTLEDAERLYSVGEIYPCYIHKSLLDDTANDKEKINLKHAAQWKKPSKRKAIIWLSTGSTVTAIEIIIFIIAILLYYRE